MTTREVGVGLTVGITNKDPKTISFPDLPTNNHLLTKRSGEYWAIAQGLFDDVDVGDELSLTLYAFGKQ